MLTFLQGVLIGIVFGVPAGAVGALTLQRSFEYGFKAGLITGLGSTAADVLYAVVGILGITIIQSFVRTYQLPISIAGGMIIMGMGILAFRKTVSLEQKEVEVTKYPVMFASSLAIAVCNPATVFSFLAVFAMLNIQTGTSDHAGIELVFGIGAGTCIWWTIISLAACKLKEHATEKLYKRLYKIMGILLILFGLAVMINGIR